LAIVTIAGAAATILLRQFPGRTRTITQAVLAFIVALLAFLSWQQSKLYASPGVLYQDTLQKNPVSLTAHDNLAIALAKSGQIDQAIEHCQEALRINPNDSTAHNNLGLIFTNMGRLPQALEHFKAAVGSNPTDAPAHCNYGNALAKLGRPADAILHYQEAIRLRPNYVQAWNNLAAAYADTGRPPEAVAAAEKALVLAIYLGNNSLAKKIDDRLARYRALSPAHSHANSEQSVDLSPPPR
jgi:tetratricopeptide (TPR) repeat protein